MACKRRSRPDPYFGYCRIRPHRTHSKAKPATLLSGPGMALINLYAHTASRRLERQNLRTRAIVFPVTGIGQIWRQRPFTAAKKNDRMSCHVSDNLDRTHSSASPKSASGLAAGESTFLPIPRAPVFLGVSFSSCPVFLSARMRKEFRHICQNKSTTLLPTILINAGLDVILADNKKEIRRGRFHSQSGTSEQFRTMCHRRKLGI